MLPPQDETSMLPPPIAQDPIQVPARATAPADEWLHYILGVSLVGAIGLLAVVALRAV